MGYTAYYKNRDKDRVYREVEKVKETKEVFENILEFLNTEEVEISAKG